MAVDTKLVDLPEDILCKIFSSLPMGDAARASASCSTLLGAWRGHAHLVFDEDTVGLRLLEEEEEEIIDFDDEDTIERKDFLYKKMDELAGDFVRFVDAALLRHRSDAALETLALRFAYLRQGRHAAFVDRWVRFAIGTTTTRHLELDFLAHQREPYTPDSLCYDFPSSLLLKLVDLPEDILCKIFSSLPMGDAARASASCSTLLGAWRGHAHLVFDEDTVGLRLLEEEEEEIIDFDDEDTIERKDFLYKKMDELAGDFVRFVDAALLRHRSDAALETLALRFAYLRQGRHAAFVDRWVRFAIGTTTTRHLELDFLAHQREPYTPDSLCYDFPSSLLLTPAAMALEHLHLSSGCLRWPTLQQEYLNLTTVLLDTVRLTSQDLERFLYSCHKLQSLNLTHCDDLVYVKVPPRSRQLGSIALRQCRSVKTVDLSDSRVASLTFLTRNCQPNILGSVAPAPSVTRASIKILVNPVEPAGIFESTCLARLMPGLERLSLRVYTMQVKVVTSPGDKYRHLKRLDIRLMLQGNCRQRDDFIFLHRFLDAAPALESLSMDVMSSVRAFDASQMPPGVEFFRKHPSSPHFSLKTVTITGFDADLASLELALYILENARPLRRLSLDPSWYDATVMARSSKTRLFARDVIRRHIAPRISGDIVLEVL